MSIPIYPPLGDKKPITVNGWKFSYAVTPNGLTVVVYNFEGLIVARLFKDNAVEQAFYEYIDPETEKPMLEFSGASSDLHHGVYAENIARWLIETHPLFN